MLNARQFAGRIGITEAELHVQLTAHRLPRPDEYRDCLPYWKRETVQGHLDGHPANPIDLSTGAGAWQQLVRDLYAIRAANAAARREQLLEQLKQSGVENEASRN